MVYNPVRDYRFEYLTDAVSNIEENSCSLGCVRADMNHEYPSVVCPIMAKIWDEKPMEEFDDRGDEGVFCMARIPEETINQGVLF